MDRKDFLQVLSGFEIKTNDKRSVNNHCYQNQIKLDLERINFQFSPVSNNKIYKIFLVFILTKFFDAFELTYYQGMSDVASVVVDAYFSDVLQKASVELEEIKEETLESSLDLSNKMEHIFEKILEKNEDLYNKFDTALYNILKDKFLVLIGHNFEKYSKLNRNFSDMMAHLFDTKIMPEELTIYMNYTITFFSRLSKNREVAYMIFSLVLKHDPSIVFGILAYYYEKVNISKKLNGEDDQSNDKFWIENINEKDIQRILDIHQRFILIDQNIQKQSYVLGSSQFILYFLASMATLILSIFYLYLKR